MKKETKTEKVKIKDKSAVAKSTNLAKEYAVVETGGKQMVVFVGQIIKIAKLGGEIKGGNKVKFDNVLLIDDGKEIKIGTPYVKGASVEGELVEQGKDKKIVVIKYKAKSRYFIKRGHRQDFMKVKIVKI